MSTVTGIIDGIGSAGCAIGQLFIPIIQVNLGWACIFYLFIIMVNIFEFKNSNFDTDYFYNLEFSCIYMFVKKVFARLFYIMEKSAVRCRSC